MDRSINLLGLYKPIFIALEDELSLLSQH